MNNQTNTTIPSSPSNVLKSFQLFYEQFCSKAVMKEVAHMGLYNVSTDKPYVSMTFKEHTQFDINSIPQKFDDIEVVCSKQVSTIN